MFYFLCENVTVGLNAVAKGGFLDHRFSSDLTVTREYYYLAVL